MLAMFQPHHFTNTGKYGVIYNHDETMWCGWSFTENTIRTWNDPITQRKLISKPDLDYARTWLIAKVLEEART